MKLDRLLVAAALALAAAAAGAQTKYLCRVGNAVYQSTTPCPTTGAVYYGPTTPPPGASYQPPPARASAALPFLTYMSPQCASLHDAIRTANTRGLKPETQSEMQRNYQKDCSREEAAAYTRMSEKRDDATRERFLAEQAQSQERARSSLQSEQCGESKRILIARKARTGLSEGEQRDLKRFEDNYHARCG